MSGGMILLSILEVLAVILVAAGILFESRVALAERRLLRRFRRFLRRALRCAAHRAEHAAQLRGRGCRARYSPGARQVCSAVQGYARRRL